MKNHIKTRNLKVESRYAFMNNLTLLLIISAIICFSFPHSANVGMRNTAFLGALSVGMTMFFMKLLEKYSVVISGIYEKNLITILSSFYTFCIMSAINLLLFLSKERFIADAAFALAAVVCLALTDYIADKVLCNKKKYKNPKLLIIDSDSKNFFRMKRMKYGVLKNYDSWYEHIDGMTPQEIEEFASKRFHEFDAICILNGLSEQEYNIAVKAAVEMNKELFIVPKIIDVGKTNVELVRFDDILTLYMPKHYIMPGELFVKRAMDLIISLIGLVAAIIPMVLIAAAIKLTSPGPVFYKQERLTRDKKRFWIYKFRTMVPDAEKLTGPKFAEKDDPRVTKVGKILRACRLDELPQILNILKGDMSLVGPRPERPVFVEEFEKEIENYDYRFKVKAGLTSLSHVYGRYSTYIHDRTFYDLFYITHYSFWLDLKVILLTTKTIFMKSSAEGEDDFKSKTISKHIKEEALN